VLPHEDDNVAFYLEAAEKGPLQAPSIRSCLGKMYKEYEKGHKRFEIKDSDYLHDLSTHLNKAAEARISHVRQWLKANTVRFGDKAEVSALLREFDSMAKEIRSSVALCGSKCSYCGLLCLEHKQHDETHDCQTDHKCPEVCGFSDQHNDGPVPACGMP
jgi:hypothetical protein